MAKLVQLHLSGIRSFAPCVDENQMQKLKFESPLTLILGENGCGKTTLIEAISYLCCGELFGAKKDFRDFVNDPKLSDASSSEGKIKLMIVDPKGHEVTVSKEMKAELREKMHFNSKPSLITTRSGENEVSSTFDVNTNKIRRIMSVSPAILNNVVFCHQENSTWPFLEGHKLKEKFDEIFEVGKYQKCVKIFKDEKKKRQDNINKVLAPQLIDAEEKKKYVQRQEKLLHEKENKVTQLETEIETKNKQLFPVKKQLEEICRFEKNLEDLEKQLTTKETKKELLTEDIKSIIKKISIEFEGTDEELEKEIKALENNRERQERGISELGKRIKLIDNKMKETTDCLEKAQIELGELNQAKIQYSKKCTERKKCIEEAKKANSQMDYSNNENAKTALNNLKMTLAHDKTQLNRLNKEKDMVKEEWQEAIDKIKENKLRTENSIKSKKQQLKESENKMAEISNQLNKLSIFDNDLENCKKEIETTEEAIAKLKKELLEINENNKADRYKKEIEDNELIQKTLENEKTMLQNKEIIEKKLEDENNFLQRKQSELDEFEAKYSDYLKELLQEAKTGNSLMVAIQEKQEIAKSDVANLTVKIKTIEKEVTTLEVLRKSQLEKIAKCEKKLESKEKTISQTYNGKNFNEILDAASQRKDNLLRDKVQYNSMEIIFNQYIKEFEKECPSCPICESSFDYRSDIVKTIIAKLQSELEKIPENLDAVEAQLKEEETFYNKLQQLKLINDEIEMLKAEAPLLKSQLDDMDYNLKKELAELDDLKNKLEEPQKIIEISRYIIADVAVLDQNQHEMENSKRTIENLAVNLSQLNLNKSKEEVEAEINSIISKMDELRQNINEEVKKINSCKDELQRLTQTRVTLGNKQNQLNEEIRSKSLLETLLTETNSKITKLKIEIPELEAIVHSVEEELKNATENKQNEIENFNQQIENAKNKIKISENVVENIQRLQNEIEDYLKEENERKLSDTKNKLENYKKRIKKLEEIKTRTNDKILKTKNQLSRQELKFRELEDNAILREKRILETKLESEIQNLKDQMNENVDKTVVEEKHNLQIQREILEKKVSFLKGEKREVETTITEIRQDLSNSVNKDAYLNYRSKYYEVEIAKKVVHDLSKYIDSLERAIFKFHLTKLVQINKSIKELWRNIYRGNDIDYIEIKSVLPKDKAKKQTCIYKIVQIKNGIKLDMRKKCSVGQKNLACLIIRMALAETLSSNCGILALDEPTTNLDRENVQSLCDTLSTIISHRRKETNFQLLIITHDEEFLHTLSRVQSVSCYYRITRDTEGFSRINREVFRL